MVVLFILTVTAWFGWKALNDAKPDAGGKGGGGRPPSAVIFRPAEKREIVETLTATGTLRATRRAEVAAIESGAIESLSVDEGDAVEAGAVLAKIDARRLEAQLQEASAGLTSAKAELAQREAEQERAVQDEEMMRGLWDQRAVAEREYLDSLREMKVAEARTRAAKEMIEAAAKRLELLEVRQKDLEVRAPFAGRVVVRHTELGEWVSEGAPVVTLVSTGEAEAWLQLPERHASLLRETSPAQVELKFSGVGESISADKLTVIPEIDGGSRRFTLVAHIPDPENRLTPGSSVTATVPLGEAVPRVIVPTDAILTSYAGNYVFVPDRSGEGPPTAKRVDVQLLFERAGEAVLADGALEEGAEVIVEGNERLMPGAPIAPKPWVSKEAPPTAEKETAQAR
ncbi:RND family efflux transporter, MFP subunit [Haloferula helveola]|uniref:RND family efflux transporter, MFP subunit n=1 Tax=Haloferula helveola TaxID=490095 RepID=A0ABN6H8N7_9BACT|nr:RND family efflux transporter, MFP subunit [Haloferula helveola]